MTNPGVSEHDLIDLVEGTLPDDRVEAVRTALTADPALLRRVEQMVADRRALRSMLASDLAHARAPELAELALARAERGALLGDAGAPGRSAPLAPGRGAARRVRPVVAGGVLAGALTLCVGVLLVAIRPWSGPSPFVDVIPPSPLKRGGTVASATDDAPAGPPEPSQDQLAAAETDSADAPLDGLMDEGLSAAKSAAPAPDIGDARSAELGDTLARGQAAPEPPALVALDEPRLEALRERLSAPMGERGAGAAGANAERDAEPASRADAAPFAQAMPGRLSLERAAELAMSGQVRLVVPRGAASSRSLGLPQWIRPRRGVEPEGARVSTFDESGRAVRTLTATLDEQQVGVRDALLGLLVEFGGPASGARFEAEPADAPATPATPSLEPEDVLWWTRPPAEWRQRVKLTVPLVIEDAVRDEAQPPPEAPASPTTP